jgi:hypothetical protein
MTHAGRTSEVSDLSNEGVALAALLACGGDLSKIDTEDVALRADALSPGRFRWRKYKDHIDLGLVRNGLQDAKKTGNVRGGAHEGWALTDLGVVEAREMLSRLGGVTERVRLTPQQQAWRSRERTRLLTEEAFKAATGDQLDRLSVPALLRFFRIDEYVDAKGRADRVSRLVNAFDGDAELGPVVRALAEKLKND